MVFSSIPFVFFFLPVFLLLYYLAPGRIKNAVLLVFSLLFYAWGEPKYILLMLISTLVDYLDGIFLGLLHAHPTARKFCLGTALLINLGLLAFFKYADFAVGIWNALTPWDAKLPGIALPIGISFYTFQTVSYSIDVYRENIQPEKNYFSYLTYVSMFPQLIAGPIVRFSTVQKELHERKITESGFVLGARRFLLGLMRKILIADQLGELWELLRHAPGISALTAWLGLLCFTLQLYYDFSAYSDMAIGLGRMLGFHFPENFIYPLSATSVTDFWRRWHISLSTWFRDYVYIPLGGNRVSVPKHLRNLFAVWFLTGLWHGASWNFVIWGLYHGIFLVLEKYVWGKKLEKLPAVLKHLYAIVIVVVGFGIFTFDDLHELAAYFPKLICMDGNAFAGSELLWYAGNYLPFLLAALLLAFPVYPALTKRLETVQPYRRKLIAFCAYAAMTALFLLAVAAMVGDSYSPFLYFRF
ncbi:MAG: MBOAT family protein [Lachnospiraceae bacterium]|nr:MBOAT family protein [Lachnospiraceae bacterium]